MDAAIFAFQEAVHAGGSILQHYFGSRPTAEELKQIERNSQVAILSVLKDKLPCFYELSVLPEERDEVSLEQLRHAVPGIRLWEPEHQDFFALDPLDGTSLYANCWPEFGISLAQIAHGKPILAAVLLPATGDLLLADMSEGCYLNGHRIILHDHWDPDKSMVGLDICRGIAKHRPEFHKAVNLPLQESFKYVRNMPSVASGVDLLRGRTVAHVTGNAKLWDVAATACAVEAAGGRVSQLNGSPIPWTSPDIPPILLSAGENVTRYIQNQIDLSAVPTADAPVSVSTSH